MDKLLNIFKILSDETRLRIIFLLVQEELCVCELVGILDIPQPKVSKALAKLRDMNLVIDRRKEKYVFYKLEATNSILSETINNILANIEQYPQLVTDNNRLTNKENYVQLCNFNIN